MDAPGFRQAASEHPVEAAMLFGQGTKMAQRLVSEWAL